mmetsp:Transcript_102251/g.288877  ORF Transcript_102251/g.288877 Transcript_102251/m.288877 type:complete len:445 (-) Transcript_102251:201-1535(-)
MKTWLLLLRRLVLPRLRLFVLFWGMLASAASVCGGPKNVDELTAFLHGPASGYSKLTRPNVAALAGTGTPLEAALPDTFHFQVQFNQVLEVNMQLQHFTVDVLTIESWYDWRLRHNDSVSFPCISDWSADASSLIHTLPMTELGNIWFPTIDYPSVLEQPKALSTALFIRSDGSVEIGKRQIFKFACLMDLADMPFDVQRCVVPVASYAYTPKQLTLAPGIAGAPSSELMTVAPQQAIFVGGSTEWNLDEDRSGGETVCADLGVVGSACTLQLTFAFRRTPTYYLDYVVAPTIFCVLLSWATFFVASSAAPARVAMAGLSFLTCNASLNGILAKLPRTSGDVWLLRFVNVSMPFTLYACLEYAFVNYIMHKTLEIKCPRRSSAKNNQVVDISGHEAVKGEFNSEEDAAPEKGFILRDYHVDIFSRIVYMLVYIVVLLVFFVSAA